MKTNWKTKLKTVLEEDEISEVSTKTELRLTAETHSDVVSAVNHSGELVDTSRNFDELTELKSERLHAHLNRFIENGIKFEVCADYFICEQRQLNEYNLFVDAYNAAVDKCRNDESLMRDVETILDEQKAVMMIDGKLSEAEADRYINRAENLRTAVMSCV